MKINARFTFVCEHPGCPEYDKVRFSEPFEVDYDAKKDQVGDFPQEPPKRCPGCEEPQAVQIEADLPGVRKVARIV